MEREGKGNSPAEKPLGWLASLRASLYAFFGYVPKEISPPQLALPAAKIALLSAPPDQPIFLGPYRELPLQDRLEELADRLGLEAGYHSALETQRAFGLLKPEEKIPTFQAVLSAFTPEMLESAATFQDPKLILVNGNSSFEDLVEAMNSHKTMEGQQDVSVNEIYESRTTEKLSGWQAYIEEGAAEIGVQDFDNLDLAVEKRLENFEKYKKRNRPSGITGMNRMKYIYLAMQALHEGVLIDFRNWTILDEYFARKNFLVPDVGWYPDRCRVDFSFRPTGNPSEYVRFRCSVGGVVKMA